MSLADNLLQAGLIGLGNLVSFDPDDGFDSFVFVNRLFVFGPDNFYQSVYFLADGLI